MSKRGGTGHRAERIASVIKRDVSVIVDSLADPRIHGVSVTDVVMSRDLKYANVYVSVENNDKSVVAALNGCAGYVRHELAEVNIEMRGVPTLNFVLDNSQSYYEHIEQVIKGFHNDGSM